MMAEDIRQEELKSQEDTKESKQESVAAQAEPSTAQAESSTAAEVAASAAEPAAGASSESTAEPVKAEPSLEERLAATEAERDQYKDLLLRKAAEFENFRRQKEREMAALIKFADKNLIKQILPIIDDLERVISNAEKFLANNPDAKVYVEGVRLVHQKLMKTLEARQVKRMETLGKKFDHNFHEALTQMPKADVEPDTIVEEFEPGYLMHDEVIRHAKVVVAKPIE
ncbi:MAG: nucleotide exchange factor GrpE [Chloroherpetonaceae bacterium]|nr:nucleotide exchange factor GrpE [Chloroherpetonaceae bacterium]MCS7210896.1 nucleotide exchange factor GrpE [Chloroherpetonaceae bacterium]MDW8020882.1 nucleotide exchange factor GrpE [Chloroherpetonaceae bacterium]MDW8466184.1 nucleotide exchange factor GrpE [Chloroherpetonaceae bacterium]